MNEFENKFETNELTPKTPEGSGLRPITQKEFNKFIKGKGVKGRNDYKLKELKAMFGFRPITMGKPVSISLEGEELTTYDSISTASTSTGIPYCMLMYAKTKCKVNGFAVVKLNGKKYCIKCDTV